MIIELKHGLLARKVKEMMDDLKAAHLQYQGKQYLVASASLKTLPARFEEQAEKVFPMDSDIQLASKKFQAETREIRISDEAVIGGEHQHTLMITGPCSVESEEQLTQCAEFVHRLGIKVLRGGCYKPRTSPYSFQGLGLEGLQLLAKMREKYGLMVVTEVRDATHVEEVIEHTDIIQVGAKAMYDHGILRACGKSKKPVLLKRGFGSSLQEFVQAAEFILSGGNPDVMLCERGIRTFEQKTRFTLDLCGVSYLKEYTNLPIILDTSHAMGYRYGVPDLTRACVAMGIDGLLIESHPNPAVAKSDSAQQLNFEDFEEMYNSLGPVAAAVGREMI